MKSVQKGFTLIELMIVIAIIGILAAIAMPAYQDYTIRAQVGEGAVMASKLKVADEDYFADKGTFPTQLSDIYGAGSPEATPTNHQGNYVSSMALRGNGEIDVTYGNNANNAINGNVLTLRPIVSTAGDVSWACAAATVPGGFTDSGTDATTVPAKYLPSSCKP